MSEEKKMLREKFVLIRKNLYDRAKKNSSLFANLQKIPAFKKAKVVHIYLSTKDEVSTGEIIAYLHKNKKTVLVPVVDGKTIFSSKIGKELTKNRWGILEPKDKAEYSKKMDLIIIPGVVFDVKGNRIGYGKGYYDRFLTKQHLALRLGLAFEEQIVDYIPAEKHDITMDYIVTDTKVIKI